MSIQEGAKYLERPFEGRGILLGGRAGRRAGRSRRSSAAASSARTRPRWPPASGPTSRILDINLDRLRYLDDVMPPNVTTLYSATGTHPRQPSSRADLVIGAVLIPGAKAPRLVRREDLEPDEAAAR